MKIGRVVVGKRDLLTRLDVHQSLYHHAFTGCMHRYGIGNTAVIERGCGWPESHGNVAVVVREGRADHLGSQPCSPRAQIRPEVEDGEVFQVNDVLVGISARKNVREQTGELRQHVELLLHKVHQGIRHHFLHALKGVGDVWRTDGEKGFFNENGMLRFDELAGNHLPLSILLYDFGIGVENAHPRAQKSISLIPRFPGSLFAIYQVHTRKGVVCDGLLGLNSGCVILGSRSLIKQRSSALHLTKMSSQVFHFF